jgi:hypothetical protein
VGLKGVGGGGGSRGAEENRWREQEVKATEEGDSASQERR